MNMAIRNFTPGLSGPSGALRCAAAGLLLAAMAGCSATQDMLGMSTAHVPEGANVEAAPYPSLATAPQHMPPINEREPGQEVPERQRAADIRKEMTREANRLRNEARRLDTEKTGGRVVVTHDQRAAEALASEEAAVKAVDAGEAARLRAEIEAELNAAFGEDAAPAAAE